MPLATIALPVHDHDEAIAFYTQAMGFERLEHTPMDGGKCWVRLAPPGGGSVLLLARAATPVQSAAVGDQSGGRVFLFLHGQDFEADGTRWTETPRDEAHGRVVLFLDRYGNTWDLIQPR